jgi:aminoglycoside/choline kinase family phosphotransferase/dTDP-glucose pyrophosphorylase
MKAMILAAGYGTRLRPYTNHTPKPLFTIAGRPLLDNIIRRLEKAGCQAVIINTHHLHQQIEAFLSGQHYGLEIHTRHEPEILGTGGAIKNVSDFWDNRPFMVINADIVADIDLADIYNSHRRHRPAATLVLCDDPTFNSVSVEQNEWVTGFPGKDGNTERKSNRLLTFTGVQVLEPLLLDYIPPGVPFSSIDAFRQIMADGKKLRAVVVPKSRWEDIGTPESYRQAAIDSTVPLAFEKAFQTTSRTPVDRIKLKGDGSQRQWYRLKSRQGSLVMVDHGIRETRRTSEVDAFVRLGRHLRQQGVAVPEIFFHDTFSGLVFLEDLGDQHLQQSVKAIEDKQEIVRLYRTVIDRIMMMSRSGAEGFDRSWTYQTSDYDQDLILEKECRYFQETFLNGYLGYESKFEDFEQEFKLLAERALQHASIGFMHRDMQSRNIMLRKGRTYFIDFQGGRMGPVQYDLASLLIDPYVELPQQVQDRLLDYCTEKLSATAGLNPDHFRNCYRYCALTRNLQILGAFAYLSRVTGKTQFEPYIPPAVTTLRSNLKACDHKDFPRLSEVVEKVYKGLKSKYRISNNE